MSITLTVGGTTLTLNHDLHWDDEFAWTALEQTIDRSVTGAMIVQQGVRTYGRAITLKSPTDDMGAITRAQALQIQTWSHTPEQPLTLVLRGATHKVLFNHTGDAAPFEMAPMSTIHNTTGTDLMLVTLRFITIPE